MFDLNYDMTQISKSSDKALKTPQECENVSNIIHENQHKEQKVEKDMIDGADFEKTGSISEATFNTIKPTQDSELCDTDTNHENPAKSEKMENSLSENNEKSTDILDGKIFLDCFNIEKFSSEKKAAENSSLAEIKNENKTSENKEQSKNLNVDEPENSKETIADDSDDDKNPWKDNKVSTGVTSNVNFQNIPCIDNLLIDDDNNLLNGGKDNTAFVSD